MICSSWASSSDISGSSDSMAPLMALAPKGFLLLFAHYVPVILFEIGTLLAPVQMNLHQVFFLNQSIQYWQEILCCLGLPKCFPPILVDLHTIQFQEFYGGYKEIIFSFISYCKWTLKGHNFRLNFVSFHPLEDFLHFLPCFPIVTYEGAKLIFYPNLSILLGLHKMHLI